MTDLLLILAYAHLLFWESNLAVLSMVVTILAAKLLQVTRFLARESEPQLLLGVSGSLCYRCVLFISIMY